MTSRLRFFSSLFSGILLLAVGFATGIVADRRGLIPGLASPEIPREDQEYFRLMAEAWNTIDRNYADQEAVDDRELTYGAISGMVDALGDTGHSRFLDPDMLREQQNYIQGEFEGIGALIEMRDGQPVIVTPLDGSPAQRAGIQPGDIILAVDGVATTGRSLGEVVSRVLGPAGTEVTLTVQDPETGERREVTITRERIELQNVTWQMLPGTQVAHVRIASFSEGVTEDLKEALREAQSQGATSVILDLRNNPGGLLSEAVGVASQFLEEGTVLLQQDAEGKVEEVPVEPGGVAPDLPLVVLINQGSASASEIVAGALQDAGRATLVGETTFGTGTVLNQYPLSDGSALLLATEQWLTPKGRVIWHQGIQPDVTVALPEDANPLIPETERDLTAEELQEAQDTQLLKALEILNQK